MFTQCPSCQTLFKISPEQLRIARGKVRCSQCANIFNALDDLRAKPNDAPKSLGKDKMGAIVEHIKPKDPLSSTANQGKSAIIEAVLNQSAPNLPEVPLYDDTIDSNSYEVRQVAELQSRADNVPELGNELIPLTNRQQEIVDDIFDHLDDEVVDEEELTGNDEPPKRLQQTASSQKKGIFFPFIGVFLLLGVAATQLLWIERDRMMQHPQGNLALSILCEVLSCELPEQRQPEKIKIHRQSVLRSSLNTHQLSIKLSFSNQASFPQIFPSLELSLFNDAGEITARKEFTATQYLGVKPLGDNQFLQPDQLVYVQLKLRDDGMPIAGYQFKFL